MSWRELIEQVVPPDKREEYRITAMGPPASPSALADVEAVLNVALPAELRSLLEEMNGVHDRFFRIILSAEDIQEVNLAFRNDADYPELYMPFDCLLVLRGIRNRRYVCLCGACGNGAYAQYLCLES
jgi:hypothetical protein